MKTATAVVLLLGLFAVATLAIQTNKEAELSFRLRGEFKNFVTQYERVYDSDEMLHRYELFRKTYLYIEEHNAHNTDYTLGINQFADMTEEEFALNYLGAVYNQTAAIEDFADEEIEDDTERVGASCPRGTISPGSQCDWRAAGAVNPIRNQGSCGSCWAFATVGAVEGAFRIARGRSVSLSEQQLVDCAGGAYGNHGCNGGWPQRAFKYVRERGLEGSSTYAYTGKTGACHASPAKVVARIRNHVDLTGKGEAAVTSALATAGPTAVAIDASRPNFRYYKTGVYTDPTCSKNVGHAVLAVGYGSTGGADYFIVRNSWGTTFGNQGYILMARNKGNQCAIGSYGTYPLV